MFYVAFKALWHYKVFAQKIHTNGYIDQSHDLAKSQLKVSSGNMS